MWGLIIAIYLAMQASKIAIAFQIFGSVLAVIGGIIAGISSIEAERCLPGSLPAMWAGASLLFISFLIPEKETIAAMVIIPYSVEIVQEYGPQLSGPVGAYLKEFLETSTVELRVAGQNAAAELAQRASKATNVDVNEAAKSVGKAVGETASQAVKSAVEGYNESVSTDATTME